MPIYRDKKRGAYHFEFDRQIEGQRVRATKILPRTWTQAQATEFDRKESGRLYAIATKAGGVDWLIEDAIAKYVQERCTVLKNGRRCAMELQALEPFYAGRTLSGLVDVCKQIRLDGKKSRGGDASPATITNRIRYLVAACRYSWKHHGMGTADPGAGVVTPKVSNQRDRYIGEGEMLRLVDVCQHEQTKAMILIAFYSGMRLGEIQRAKVSGTAFVLTDTKNGEPRIIPIHPRLYAHLQVSWPSRFVLRYWFDKARADADMPWLHIHDLRHSAATAMIEAGVEVYTVGAVLGHKSAASTKRYAHHSVGKLAQAIEKIGKRAA